MESSGGATISLSLGLNSINNNNNTLSWTNFNHVDADDKIEKTFFMNESSPSSSGNIIPPSSPSFLSVNNNQQFNKTDLPTNNDDEIRMESKQVEEKPTTATTTTFEKIQQEEKPNLLPPNTDYNNVGDDDLFNASTLDNNQLFSMRQFYDGKTLLCTGCTGFIGKTLVEKILRCLPNVNKAYLLIRTKKQVDRKAGNSEGRIISGYERMVNDIIRSPIMDRLIDERFKGDRTLFEEYALSKLSCVEGDVTDTDIFFPNYYNNQKPEENCKRLCDIRNEVNIVIHVAATVGFTEPLPDALRLNVFGTLNMLRFTLHCPNVQCFTHVSTAYVNSNQPSGSKIFERFYPLHLQNSTVGEKQKKHRIRKLVTGYTNTQEYTQGSEEELEEIEQFCERIFSDFSFERFFDMSSNPNTYKPDVHNKEDQNFMTQFTNTVLKNTKFPNTYTLTKHLAEKLVAKYHGRVPVSIVRPTIVGAALKEPQPGWIDAVSAGAAVYLFIGLCVLRIIPGKYDSISDQIPVDFVVNCLLMTPADVVTRQTRQRALTIQPSNKVDNERGLLRIYHSGTSTTNPAPWRTTATRVAEYWRKCPSKRKIAPDMSPNILMIENPINYNTQFFLRYTAWSQLFKVMDRLSHHYQNSVSMLNGSNDLLGNLIKSLFSNETSPTDQNVIQTTKYSKLAADLLKVEQRAQSLGEHFYHFTMNEWFFDSSHVLESYDRIQVTEREYSFGETSVFNLDYDFDWTEYLELFCYGIQRFFLKEEPPFIPPQQQQHRAQQMRLRIAMEEEEKKRSTLQGANNLHFRIKNFRNSKL